MPDKDIDCCCHNLIKRVCRRLVASPQPAILMKERHTVSN